MDRRKRAIDAYRRVRDGAGERAAEGFEKTAERAPASGDSGGARHEAGSTESSPSTPESIAMLVRGSGAERAARLLVAVGSERAAEIMRLLEPAEVEAISSAIVRTGTVRRSELDAVLAEAARASRERAARGGPEAARQILVAAFGADEGERLFFRAVPNAPERHFAFLNDLEAAQLHAVVKDESPAAAALILAHVKRELAAEVLKRLAREVRSEVARRIARMGKLSRDVVLRVEEAVREKIRVQGRQITQGVDGPAKLAAILRHMSPSVGDTLLAELREANADLGETIRGKLYTTELLHELSDRHLADLFREFSDRETALFLKGKDERLRARVLRVLSDRRATSVSEEYAHLGAQARAEVDRVTAEVLGRLRDLEESGSILVPREGDRYI